MLSYPYNTPEYLAKIDAQIADVEEWASLTDIPELAEKLLAYAEELRKAVYES